MGFVYPSNRREGIMLADQLGPKLDKCAQELMDLKMHNVPKAMILRFLETLVVPKISYGPEIDIPESK